MKVLATLIILTLCLSGTSFGAISDNPMSYFNVYSLGNIGSTSQNYGSDFVGVAGAAGSVYFSGFSLDGTGATDGYCLRVGGSAYLSGAFAKSVSADGGIYLGGVSVGGSVAAGGNILPRYTGAGGSVAGNAIAGGTVSLGQSITVSGSKLSGQSYTAAVDFSAVNSYFTTTSSHLGSLAGTGSIANNWGGLSFTGTSGVNVITIDATTLKNAWGFAINAPADATVVINVLNSSVTLDSTTWTYSGGITSGQVLLNLVNATTFNLSGDNDVNILAPLADTYFSSGVLNGGLYVGNLTGGGQVNLGSFRGEVPEPASMAMLVCGATAMLIRRRRLARA